MRNLIFGSLVLDGGGTARGFDLTRYVGLTMSLAYHIAILHPLSLLVTQMCAPSALEGGEIGDTGVNALMTSSVLVKVIKLWRDGLILAIVAI
mmetsp:Transcript_14861/g.24802  ORF Transcript_14861/g.24802 Transcript_14861/m.24802 type:complete len:93 (+) Transcript_14861:37-315(+)